MLEHTKLTKNESLWIFLIANDASLGIFGFSSIILRAISLIDSIVAPNSLLFFSGFNSGISLIFAVIYGSSETICSIENLFFPWIITVTLPSGIFRTLNIFATVPVGWISLNEGDWTLESFWETTPINLSFVFESLISFIDLSLEAVIGITTPGNITVFFRGRIGSVSGRDSFEIASSSSEVINGIKSESSSIFWSDIMSRFKILVLDIKKI